MAEIEDSWITSLAAYEGVKAAVWLSSTDLKTLVETGSVTVKTAQARDRFAVPSRDRVVEVSLRIAEAAAGGPDDEAGQEDSADSGISSLE